MEHVALQCHLTLIEYGPVVDSEERDLASFDRSKAAEVKRSFSLAQIQPIETLCRIFAEQQEKFGHVVLFSLRRHEHRQAFNEEVETRRGK